MHTTQYSINKIKRCILATVSLTNPFPLLFFFFSFFFPLVIFSSIHLLKVFFFFKDLV